MKRLFTVVFILMFCTAFIAGCSSPAGQKGVYRTTKTGWAALDPQNLKLMVENYKDEDFIKKLYADKAIMPLKVGLEFTIVEDHGAIVRVRSVKNDAELWTFKNILQKT